MKAIIVEDSRLARVDLTRLLKPFSEIELIGESGEPIAAIELINERRPDLLFLDIQMPGLNGFELLDRLDYSPLTIFTTAYDQYAVRSFDYDAVDYILKPIEQSRLANAVAKCLSRGKKENIIALPLDMKSSVFIKDGESCWMAKLVKISMLESCTNYTKVYFEGNSPLIHKSLNQLETRLPKESFFRANRQQIINLNFIVSVEPWFNGNLRILLQDDVEVEVSRRHSNRFKNMLSL
ncbi:MAG: LytTR family DNA-binding domain-containing protein [Shewanella sp.]